MLYVTTRDQRDAYTSYRAICENVGPDGGRFMPFSLPAFTSEEMDGFQNKSFSQTVAELLNLFFSSRLTSWDVDFCIGRNPARLQQMNHRLVIAELWRNLDGEYDYVVKSLSKVISGDQSAVASNWMCIAIRIAFLFGVYGEMLRNGVVAQDAKFDVSVLSGDFSEPMAVYYAQKMGLPVGCIICTSTDSSSVWDFLHRGTFSPVGTTQDLQLSIELLIADVFGTSEVSRFAECCKKGTSYSLNEEQLPLFNNSFFCAVAGDSRAASTINSLFRTNGYVTDPKTAICFGGLQDYRARTGESQITLLLSEQSPLNFADEIMSVTGIDRIKLDKLIKS